MSWRHCIILVTFGCICIQAKAQELPFTHYTPDREVNALPSAMITNIYQDRQGFIWMSVFSSGLIRFDGVRMILFDHHDGLNDLGVWQITEDAQGYLWISSNGGLLVTEEPLASYSSGKRIAFTSEVHGTPLISDALSHNQIAADTSGAVWAGTVENGFIRYRIKENEGLTADTVSTDLNGNGMIRVNSVAASRNGSVLAGLEGGYLIRIENDSINLIYHSGVISSDQNFVAIFEDSEEKLWAYRQNGEILLFHNRTGSPETVYRGPPSNIAGLTGLSDDIIWASSGSSGITWLDKNTGVEKGSYTRTNGLLSENVFQVLEDREGNVWIAQSGGLSKLRYNFRAFENYSTRSVSGEKPALPSARVNTVFISDYNTNPCRMWVGTEGGVTCINKNGSSQFITQSDGLSGDWVNGLADDPSGRLWIATTQGLNGISFADEITLPGAFDIRSISIFGTHAKLFSIPESPPFIAAENRQLYSEQTGQYQKSAWFPGLRSLYGIVGDEIYQLNSDQGLPSTLYKAVAFDGDGYLWIGTLDRGIFRSRRQLRVENLDPFLRSEPDGELFEQIWSLDNGAPTNHIEKLLWYHDKIWVGTQEGLFVLDPETAEILHHITTEDGLPANNSVSFDASPSTGNLWIGTNRGLVEMDPSEMRILRTVTRQDGLLDNEVWLYGSVQAANDGKIYYGTANGLTIYNPDLDRPNTLPPKPQLISFDISYQAEGRNEVTFEYTALSFGNVPGLRYRTRLLGYDDNWSTESTDVRLRYTNLPAIIWPKEYTLEVEAINEHGVVSELPVRYAFFVEPVWWLQWWAFLVYLVIFCTGVFVVDRIQRVRLIKKERDAARLREAELQAETANARSKASEAQAKALQAENERKALELEKARELEKAYHELKAAQNQLVQAEKMASLGRLSTGIAHEIKNPLNFINNFAELSSELVGELYDAIKAEDEVEIGFIMNNLKFNTEKIEEHGRRADSIVRSMMQHVRGGKSTFETIDLNNLVQKYTDLAYHGKRAQIPDFNASIETDLHSDIREIRVMAQEIGQVLLNIIGNSLDAVWDYKKKINGEYIPEIRVITRRTGKDVEIRISDNGPGVPEEIREKIFEPFFTTKPTGEGTGLGLSLSYDIITHGHNGTLRLESKNGKGATFIITLPEKE